MISVVAGLTPVLLFLVALLMLDSFKLVAFRALLGALGTGALAAAAAFTINTWLVASFHLDAWAYVRYGSPPVEEFLKLMYLFFLFRAGKVGFTVDAAILGFAIGAGFSVVENIYYLDALPTANPLVWLVRGLGTAVMHGGTIAIAGIIAKTLTDERFRPAIRALVPGFLLASLIHSMFNHFFLPPVASTLLLIVVLSATIALVFNRSEKSLRSWLGIGFDNDVQIIEMMNSGQFKDSPSGRYLLTLQEKFPGEVVADMLCMIRIHLELSIKAKGILMAREAGFDVAPDPDVKEKFAELQYLEKSIGPTGKLAVVPFLHTSNRDLWQMHMLGN